MDHNAKLSPKNNVLLPSYAVPACRNTEKVVCQKASGSKIVHCTMSRLLNTVYTELDIEFSELLKS